MRSTPSSAPPTTASPATGMPSAWKLGAGQGGQLGQDLVLAVQVVAAVRTWARAGVQGWQQRQVGPAVGESRTPGGTTAGSPSTGSGGGRRQRSPRGPWP